MDTTVDIEEIESTKSEKLLAVVLAAFLLIGGIWGYQEIDDRIHSPIDQPPLTQVESAAIARAEAAQAEVSRAREREEQTRQDLEFTREEYRTALDARQPAEELERSYRAAQRAYEQAVAVHADADAELAATLPAAEAVRARIAEEMEAERDRQELFTFLARLGLAAASLAAALAFLTRLRRRGSRYLPVALAAVGSATVLSIVLAGDYITDYADPQELGPLVLSVFGVVATLVAFAALQRYLARRVPSRRVRKRQCPFCGFPGGANRCCEGCGRELVSGCSGCGSSRRVGAAHCGACGAA